MGLVVPPIITPFTLNSDLTICISLGIKTRIQKRIELLLKWSYPKKRQTLKSVHRV